MQGGPRQYEGRDRLHPGHLGLGDAGAVLAQMDDLDGKALGIERLCDLQFDIEADRTTGMVEDCILCH